MLHSWINKWSHFVVEKRWLTIGVTIVLLGLLIIPMKNLYFDNSNEMWFLEDDPALQQYKKFRDIFGNGEYLIVGVEARDGDDSVFNEDTLRLITKITRLFEDHEYVTKTTSLANYQFMHSENDTLNTEDLIENADDRFGITGAQKVKSKQTENVEGDLTVNSEFGDEFGDESGFEEDENSEDSFTATESQEGGERSFQDMIEIMKKETLVHDFLITKDMKHTIISARVIRKEGTIDHHVQLVNDLNAFIEQEKFKEQGFNLHISGNPLISERFETTSLGDQMTTLPAMFLLIIFFLFLSFRTLPGVLIPMVVIFGSVITVVGVVGAFGWAFNMLNVMLPVLLMTVGIGDSTHIIVEFYHFKSEGNSPKEAAVNTTKLLWIPCFNTSLTTSIGFLAISVSSLVPLREFGIVAAIGVFVAFLISVTTLPALLSFVKSNPEKVQNITSHGIVARITQQLPPFTFKYSKIITFTGLFIVIIGVGFASQIKVDANFVNYFKDKTKIKADIKYFDKVYNGFANLEFKLDSKVAGGVKEPRFLRRALEFQNYLEGLEKTGKGNSILNYIQKMNQTMNNDDPSFFKLPESRDLVAQYLLLYENSSPEEDLTDLKSVDERIMRISLKLRNMSTAKMKVLVEKIENKLSIDFPELNATVTGDLVLFNRMDIYIQEGLVKSFSLAIGLITICFFVLLRSFKYGMLAMIPSLFPIIFAGGLMYLLGVTLDFATMIVAAITFGIAVDDSIHFMVRYARGRNSGKSRKESVHLAITGSGRALIFTSVILYSGFSVLMLSSFVPNIYFGFFAGIIILVALLADLVLLPAVIFLTGDKEGKAVVVSKIPDLRKQVS